MNPNIAYIRATAQSEDGRATLRRLGLELLIEHPERISDRAAAEVVRRLAASQLGSITSPRKAASSQANGRKGGRPHSLSDAQIAEIRASTATLVELARRYGKSTRTISRIRKGTR